MMDKVSLLILYSYVFVIKLIVVVSQIGMYILRFLQLIR